MSTLVPQPGDIVAGRYRILRCIGSGGHGTVFDAERLDGWGHVALKVLHARLGESQADLQRFEREGPLLLQLRHPHIVSVLDYGRTDVSRFIAFELLEGRPLDGEIKRVGAMSPSRVANICLQVLAALAAAHHRGVVHRDLKPANLFICHHEITDFMKVLDFGTAKVLGNQPEMILNITDTGAMVGTPQYMAPEQVRGEQVGPATDVYAMGILLIELLTGVRAIEGTTEIEIFMTHVDEAPLPVPASVRQSPLGELVCRAVQKRPEHRYPTAGAMLEHVEELTRDLGAPRSVGGTVLLPAHLEGVPDGEPWQRR